MATAQGKWDARIKPPAEFARDELVGTSSTIRLCVGDDPRLVLEDCRSAKTKFAFNLGHVQPVSTLEPDPIFIDDADQSDRHRQKMRRQLDNLVERCVRGHGLQSVSLHHLQPCRLVEPHDKPAGCGLSTKNTRANGVFLEIGGKSTLYGDRDRFRRRGYVNFAGCQQTWYARAGGNLRTSADF